jgi:hypothetical protein
MRSAGPVSAERAGKSAKSAHRLRSVRHRSECAVARPGRAHFPWPRGSPQTVQFQTQERSLDNVHARDQARRQKGQSGNLLAASQMDGQSGAKTHAHNINVAANATQQAKPLPDVLITGLPNEFSGLLGQHAGTVQRRRVDRHTSLPEVMRQIRHIRGQCADIVNEQAGGRCPLLNIQHAATLRGDTTLVIQSVLQALVGAQINNAAAWALLARRADPLQIPGRQRHRPGHRQTEFRRLFFLLVILFQNIHPRRRQAAGLRLRDGPCCPQPPCPPPRSARRSAMMSGHSS